jgi:proline dehydrogenase
MNTARKFISRLAAPVVRRAASSYIAGPELNDALRVASRLKSMNFAVTIGFWNGDDDQPRQVADACLKSLAAVHNQKLDYLSIKPPALQYSHELLEEILCKARELNVCVHFDSHGPETADRTLDLIDHGLSTYKNLSVTIPTRWKRSLRDIDWAIERKLPMRIVKGQWAESDSATAEPEFISAIQHLAGRVDRVRIATHNPQLIAESLQCLNAAGTHADTEFLYGLPTRQPLAVAKQFGAPVRFYIPFGHAWLPYCLSQAQKDPRILLRILKDSFSQSSL